jgi:3'(2'), 5'-bisphosphate nucleotidase
VPTPALPAPSDDDLAVAVALAAGAGEVLVALRAELGDSLPGKELKDAGDAAAQAWLAQAVAHARPGDAVLSEEAADDAARLEADRVWIIDPLDGTREFSERLGDGWRDDWAVHIALWQRGRGLTDAAVALPARGVVHTTGAGDAASALDSSIAEILEGTRPLRLAVSRSRPPRVVDLMAEEAGVEVVPMGSAGVKTVSVLDGTTDAYVHAGGQYEWDSAAPAAVVTSAGFVARRLDGSPLEYNRPNPWLPDLVVCHPALEGHLREILARAQAREGLDA